MSSPASEQIRTDRSLFSGVLASQPEPIKHFLRQVECQTRALIRRGYPSAYRDDLVNGFLEHLWHDDWRRLRQWRAEAPLAHYVATLFSNYQLDRLRSLQSGQQYEKPLLDPLVNAPSEHVADSPERVQESADLRDCLEKGLERVTPRQREIITLRHERELDYQQISVELRVTKGTVGSNLADAEKALRRRMQGECAELLEDLIGTATRHH